MFLAVAALLVAPLSPAAGGHLDGFPRVVLWAWERPEDLRFLAGRKAGVAFLASTVWLSGSATRVIRRRQPLLVDPATPLMAVVRVETARGAKASLTSEQREAVVSTALRAVRLPRVSAVQIDSDAAASERAFYGSVLTDLRARLDPRLGLSFTALASWCAGDRWLGSLPVDEVVPMLFQMGPDSAAIRARAAADGLAPECRDAVGFSLEEAGVPAKGRRAYLFSSEPWTELRFEGALERVNR
jgi:Protein of unknown function (DUF3142)